MSEIPPTAGDPDPPDPLSLADEGDADLLAYMDMKGDCPAHAREAWAELFRRHAGFLNHVCRRALGNLPRPPAPAEDVVTETFMRVYDRAGTYCEPPGLDADARRRNVRAWLSTLAQNLIRDLLRAVADDGPEQQITDERWNEQTTPEPCGDVINQRRLAVLEEVLREDLDERKQEVIRVTFQYHRVGQQAQRLPNEVARDLARSLRTTPENLRKIRQRAMEKIEAGLERRLAQLPMTA